MDGSLMHPSDRQELIRNAVAFLADPKTQSSSLAQRIQFLEAKGLSPVEIDIAMKQAPYSDAAFPVGHPLNSYSVAPLRNWDWRDYFITTVVTGTIAYGAVSLFKKYLLPHLQPPLSTAYEEDRDALNAQFDAAEALLKEIQAEAAAVRTAVEEQTLRLNRTTEDVKAVVLEMREGESKTRDEMREIRDEVSNIREMLPKMIDKNKDSQNQSLTELHQELKSLKALLLSRGSTISSTQPAPMPILGGTAIPAWQLATSHNVSDAPPTPTPSLVISPSTASSFNGNIGKTKKSDTELEDVSSS